MRDPSNMQAFVPATRSLRQGSLGKGKRPTETTEEVDPEGSGNPAMATAEEIFPLRLDWIPPMNQSGSNSVTNTHPASRNVSADQDPLRPLSDPLIAIISGMNTAASTPNRTPPLYFSEPPDIMSFPFDTPMRQPSETRDHFTRNQSSEIHITDVPAFCAARSVSSEWMLQAGRFHGYFDLTWRRSYLNTWNDRP